MREIKVAPIVLLAAVCWATAGWAEPPTSSLPEKTLKEFSAGITLNEEQKRIQCLKAIGDLEFCGCIASKIPVAVNFIEYVAIVSRTKVDVGYESLPTGDKDIYDTIRNVREACTARTMVSPAKK